MSVITSNKFLGWAQYTKDEFDKLSIIDKAGRLNFVREFDKDNNPIHSSIYFGSRLYAEINDNSLLETKITNLIISLGACIGENGKFKEFEIQHEILGQSSVTDVTTAIVALETSIISINQELISIKSKIQELEEIHTVGGDDIN